MTFDISDDPRGFKRLTISGSIDAEAMKDGLDRFLAALDDDEKTDFLYTITDFSLPTGDALGVEFSYLPSLFASIRKVGRVAVIADQQWVRTAASVEGRLIPGVQIKSFEPGEEDDAIAWLTR